MNAEEYRRYVVGVKTHGRTRYAQIVLDELEQQLRADKTLKVVHEHVHHHVITTVGGSAATYNSQHEIEDIIDVEVIDGPPELEAR